MRGEYDGIASFEDLVKFFEKLPNPDKQFAVMPGIAHASFQQKNYTIVYHILLSFFTQPEPIYSTYKPGEAVRIDSRVMRGLVLAMTRCAERGGECRCSSSEPHSRCALIALTGPAIAQDAVDAAKAKAEGKVVWYTSTPIEQAQKIVDLFKQETGIEVELFRSGGSAILSRFQQEIDAGRVAADVLTHSDPAAAAMRSPRKASSSPFKPKNFDKVPDAAKAPTATSSASGST